MSILDTLSESLAKVEGIKEKAAVALDTARVDLSTQQKAVSDLQRKLDLLKNSKSIAKIAAAQVIQKQLAPLLTKLAVAQNAVNAAEASYETAVQAATAATSSMSQGAWQDLNPVVVPFDMPSYGGASPTTGLPSLTSTTVNSIVLSGSGYGITDTSQETGTPATYANIGGPTGQYIQGLHFADDIHAVYRMSAPQLVVKTNFSTPNEVVGTSSINNATIATATITSAAITSENVTTSQIDTLNCTSGIFGTISAGSKAFDIPHPSKPDYRLIHGSLEGPEFGVYIRGKTNSSYIPIPDYWKDLVDVESITIQLTATDGDQSLFVHHKYGFEICIWGNNNMPYYFLVMAERKDIPQLEVEKPI